MRKNRIIPLITLLLLVFVLNGCGEDGFEEDYKQFKESYVSATSFLDGEDDFSKAIKNIDMSVVESELKNMENAVASMKKEAESKKEEIIVDNAQKNIDDLKFIVNAAKNFDKLSTDEKQELNNALVWASTERDDYK